MDFEKYQNIYSLIKTIEYLEWAFISGRVQNLDYDNQIKRLLNQYKMASESVPGFNLDDFVRKWGLELCANAYKRINEGQGAHSANFAVLIMDIT